MSDEAARIFERERRNKGLTVAEYIEYLISEQLTNYSWLPYVRWQDLEQSWHWAMDFNTFDYGDNPLTLVNPSQIIEELVVQNPVGTLPLIQELEVLSQDQVLVGFESGIDLYACAVAHSNSQGPPPPAPTVDGYRAGRTDLCEDCKWEDHQTCSLESATCPCCRDTAEQMEQM